MLKAKLIVGLENESYDSELFLEYASNPLSVVATMNTKHSEFLRQRKSFNDSSWYNYHNLPQMADTKLFDQYLDKFSLIQIQSPEVSEEAEEHFLNKWEPYFHNVQLRKIYY